MTSGRVFVFFICRFDSHHSLTGLVEALGETPPLQIRPPAPPHGLYSASCLPLGSLDFPSFVSVSQQISAPHDNLFLTLHLSQTLPISSSSDPIFFPTSHPTATRLGLAWLSSPHLWGPTTDASSTGKLPLPLQQQDKAGLSVSVSSYVHPGLLPRVENSGAYPHLFFFSSEHMRLSCFPSSKAADTAM